jgi:D-amino-acid dehydrogenase
MKAEGRVVVVGAGVVGASCAYDLAKAGRPVTVVDGGAFGAGCSHANCGFACPSHVLPLAAPGAVRSMLRLRAREDSPVRVKLGVLLRDPRWFLGFARCGSARPRSAGSP